MQGTVISAYLTAEAASMEQTTNEISKIENRTLCAVKRVEYG